MVKVVCAFAFFALCAVSANALKCYECPLGCQGDDKSKWPSQDCGTSQNTQQKACLKQVINVQNSPDRVVRKCVLFPKDKEYQCVETPGEKTTSCHTCTDDLCNSAGSLKFNIAALASIVLPLFVTKFFVH